MSAEKPQSEAAPGGEAQSAAAPGGGRKRSLVLGSSALILVALGWALAVVAVPAHEERVAHELGEPTLLGVSPANGFHVNLAESGGKHYLAVTLTTEVRAFAEAQVAERAADPLHRARLSDAVLKTASRMTKADLDDALGKESFRKELLAAFEAVLFPVHVGGTDSPGEGDAASGLRPGASIERSTLRGLYWEHALAVDAAARTIRVDGGPVTRFEGHETDLEALDAAGASVFVDVSR